MCTDCLLFLNTAFAGSPGRVELSDFLLTGFFMLIFMFPSPGCSRTPVFERTFLRGNRKALICLEGMSCHFPVAF